MAKIHTNFFSCLSKSFRSRWRSLWPFRTVLSVCLTCSVQSKHRTEYHFFVHCSEYTDQRQINPN